LFSVRADVTDRVAKQVEECRRMGLEVLPPDINASGTDFTVEDGRIRFGLAAVRGAGSKAITALIKTRKTDGPFTSLFDFCRRVDGQTVNRKVCEAFILAGAFDPIGTNRAALAAGMDRAYEAGAAAQSDKAAGQKTFFDTFEDESGFQNDALPDIPEWSEREKLAHEKATLGFYLTSHPLSRHEKEIQAFSDTDVKGLEDSEWDGPVLVGGMITAPKLRRVKSGKNADRQFAIFNLEDVSAVLEAVAFPDAWEKLKNYIVEDRIVFAKGRPEKRGGAVSLLVDDIIPVEAAKEQLTDRIDISIGFAGMGEELLQQLKEVFLLHRGNAPIFIEFTDPAGRSVRVQAGREFLASPTERLLKSLDDLLGAGHVRFSRTKKGGKPKRTGES
ncbi:MAG: helix-hairpin-helix domain-containing protein, partial [Planctomycetota bacterium]